MAGTIGGGRPAAAVPIFEFEHEGIVLAFQTDRFTLVGELAVVGADEVQAAGIVAGGKGGGIFGQYQILARGQAGDTAAGKGEGDAAAEVEIGQVQGFRAGVAEFDEFVIALAQGGVHQFRDPQILPQRPLGNGAGDGDRV
ncbi:MAG: hypothetical protein BWY71_02206 [Planctomycetes bacterium ADurb.Bin412]|nr:MAG: hypothetical protein BWY71_02206 [Planctomycetes bacterium ADurb.Bin412]